MKYLIFILSILIVSCSITKKVKTGEEAYQLKQFSVATKLLEEEYNNSRTGEGKGRKAFLLGKSYDFLYDFDNALKWFKKSNDFNYGEVALEELAYMSKKVEAYEEAISYFDLLFKQSKLNKYNREINICKQAIKWKSSNQSTYSISSLKSNSDFSDYSPVIFEDKFLVFSSDRLTSTGDEIYDWTGNDFSDLFIMTKKGGSVYNFEASFNTAANEGSACFNKDYTEIFFTRCESITAKDEFCRIYYSDRISGFWSEPRPLLFFDETTNYGQPTLIEEDSVLIFSVETDKYSNMHDLFYSIRTEDGWSKPEAMPSSINTEGDEVFPNSYNDTLYFSSDFHPGMGGLDIFKTHLLEDNSWSKPVNLEFPINSGADDFGIAINERNDQENLLSGFFTSNRNGSDDIMKFRQLKVDAGQSTEDNESVDSTENEIMNTLYVAIKVRELKRVNGDPNGTILSRPAMPDANLKMVLKDSTSSLDLNEEGIVIKEIQLDWKYKFKAEKLGYFSDSEVLDANEIVFLAGERSKTININLDLDPIAYDTEIILDNIYYDFNRWNIREDAQIVLDSLVGILIENPLLNIQMESHTDCRGDLDYNNDLSQRRAQSTVDYLIKNNIEASRLKAIGFGEQVPKVNCLCENCSEAQHQKNRRTSFKVLKD